MKKYTFLIILISLITIASNSKAKTQYEVGFKSGLNLATALDDPNENTVTIATFGGGAFVRYTSIPQISLQIEILYMIKGFKLDFEEYEAMKLSYIGTNWSHSNSLNRRHR